MPQKHPNMVLYGIFSQPYIQYPVRARAYMRSRLFPCSILKIDDNVDSPDMWNIQNIIPDHRYIILKNISRNKNISSNKKYLNS